MRTVVRSQRAFGKIARDARPRIRPNRDMERSVTKPDHSFTNVQLLNMNEQFHPSSPRGGQMSGEWGRKFPQVLFTGPDIIQRHIIVRTAMPLCSGSRDSERRGRKPTRRYLSHRGPHRELEHPVRPSPFFLKVHAPSSNRSRFISN